MRLEDINKTLLAEDVTRIIKDYKEAITSPCMSDYKKEQVKLNAFDNILRVVNLMQDHEKENNI